MNNATYWVFFGLMPATVLLLGWAALLRTRWEVEAEKRKGKGGK